MQELSNSQLVSPQRGNPDGSLRQNESPQQGQPPSLSPFTGTPNMQQPLLGAPQQQQFHDPFVPPQDYPAPLYPRDDLQEINLARNKGFQGTYQSLLFRCGEFLGCLRAVLPCICCVEYPYHRLDQSFMGVYQRFGKYVKTVEPGLIYVNPCTDQLVTVDIKTQCIDLSRQQVLTRDNIMVNIDAAVYYRVTIPSKSIYQVTNVRSAVTELAYATLRSIIGHYTLQNVLEQRQEIAHQVQKFVDIHSYEWGIFVQDVLLKDIRLNQDLQDSLSVVAKEQRLAQAKIINAQADLQSAMMMREAASILDSKSAMQIRYLETITTLGRRPTTKVIFLPDD